MHRTPTTSPPPLASQLRTDRPIGGRFRPPDPADRRRITTAALRAGWFAVGTQLFLLPGLVGAPAPAFPVSIGLAGTAIAAFSLAYGLGGPILHQFVATMPPRRALLVSLGTFAAAALGSAAAPTIGVLLAAQVAGGLAASVWGPVSVTTAVAAAGADRVGRTLGGFHAASSLALIAGAPVGLLLARSISWRVGFGLIAGIAGIAFAVLVARRPMTAVPVTRRSVGAVAVVADREPAARVARRFRVPRLPGVRRTLVVTLLVMTASGSVFSYLGLLLAGHPGPLDVELCLTLFGVAGVAGTWLGGRAADRWGGRAVALPSAAVLIGVTAMLPPLIAVTPAMVAIVLVWGLCGWAFVPGQQHRLITEDLPAATILLAWHSSAVQLGFAAGALAGGLVIDAGGVSWLWIVPVLAGIPAIGGLFTVGGTR